MERVFVSFFLFPFLSKSHHHYLEKKGKKKRNQVFSLPLPFPQHSSSLSVSPPLTPHSSAYSPSSQAI